MIPPQCHITGPEMQLSVSMLYKDTYQVSGMFPGIYEFNKYLLSACYVASTEEIQLCMKGMGVKLTEP